ncbi:acetylgalactosaminyl-O-glycosyl-glycoprotein beta-1,3-N-acetylglucosaminyltransferase-like [Xenopus tropicalis]|uniref:Hexosyltransferase n=1 Tax=Xenopus tropicalis TaxID=8364 RepID=A0A803J424_XENTR|nr:acetylgalactosaminyl-O-glycosyl-glycoprotein beta-1,3-N-acetylglucosaminyltransferase-like [Xenopus tropicalis]
MKLRLRTQLRLPLYGFLIFSVSLIIWDPGTMKHFLYPRDSAPELPPAGLPIARGSATLYDGHFTFRLNLSQFQWEFPHLQSYRCSLALGPRGALYKEMPEKLLLLAIKSHPGSGARRAALRQTWASERLIGSYRVKHLFLLATTPVRGQMELVRRESQEFGDILQWDFTEGHHNLSLKERCFLEWLHLRLPHVAFVFKGDDDEFMNPQGLVGYISQHSSSPHTLHGALQRHSVVLRRHIKYKVSWALFPNSKYPFFLSGGGFLIPGGAVGPLYVAAQTLPVFPLDDVYLGFLALAANLTYRHEPRFYVFGLKYNACRYQRALVVHRVGPDTLVRIWAEVQRATCQGER